MGYDDPEGSDTANTLQTSDVRRKRGRRAYGWIRTSTQVTFWRLLEAILPGPAAGSRGVARLEIVARASDNGAFAMKDMCMRRAVWGVAGSVLGGKETRKRVGKMSDWKQL
jgi:hypothetical protein